MENQRLAYYPNKVIWCTDFLLIKLFTFSQFSSFISQLIDALKTTSSKHIHLANYGNFQWQRSYHDRIVRNPDEFRRISKYIDDNPKNWEKDRLNGRFTV